MTQDPTSAYASAYGGAVKAALEAVKAAGHTKATFDLSGWPKALDEGAQVALKELYKRDLSLFQGSQACRAVSEALSKEQA